MKKQIAHISLHQNAKVLSILLFIVLAVVSIPFGMYLLLFEDRSTAAPFFLSPFYMLSLPIFFGLSTACFTILSLNTLAALNST